MNLQSPVLQGIDAFNRIAFDAVAHNIQIRSPIALPVIAPVTEDEDRKNLENLQQILNIFMNSESGLGVRTLAGMTGGRGGVNGATNRATRSTANPRSITQVLPQLV